MEIYPTNIDTKRESPPPQREKEGVPTKKDIVKSDNEIPRNENPYFQHLTASHLEEALASKEKTAFLEQGNVQLVLHPFYEMFLQNEKSFDVGLWEDIQKHPEKYERNKPAGIHYCEQWIIREMNRTMNESNENGLSLRYWRVMEMAQEYQTLLAQRNSPHARIIILPKYHSVGTESTHNPALYSALIDIANYGTNGKSFFIESEKWSNGSLNGTDSALMQMLIPKKSRLSISGGYIGQCMNNLLEDLKGPTEKMHWDIQVNVEESTPVMFFDETHPGVFTDLPPQVQPKFRPHQQFSNIEEVLAFVKRNASLNQFIIEGTRKNSVDRKDSNKSPPVHFE